MKVIITREEWYPVYTIQESGNGREISDDLVAEVNAVNKAFAAVQDKLKKWAEME